MTSTQLPVSVTLITLNEADRIADAILSVRDWVSEVVVIDSGSTDDTVQVAEALGARVFYNPWPGYGQQKRFAEDQATEDWILNIDADERILPELQQELQQLFQQPDRLAEGYHVAIHDRLYLTDRLSSYTPYNPVRLYRKSCGRYSDSPVHDRVIMQDGASTGQLKGRIAHDSLRSFGHRLDKMNAYTDAQARDMLNKGRKPSRIRMVIDFWISFISGYCFRGYWRGGLMGYIYAMNFAYSRFLRQIKLYELQQQAQNERADKS